MEEATGYGFQATREAKALGSDARGLDPKPVASTGKDA